MDADPRRARAARGAASRCDARARAPRPPGAALDRPPSPTANASACSPTGRRERDTERALAAGAEGIGLYRTEFLFMGRHAPPTEAEQAAAYRSAFEAFGPERPVVIRLADIGGDKQLPYLDLAPEAEPVPRRARAPARRPPPRTAADADPGGPGRGRGRGRRRPTSWRRWSRRSRTWSCSTTWSARPTLAGHRS